MNIEYTISKDSKREYRQAIRNRIKDLKSSKLGTESHICNLAARHAERHGRIDCVLQLVHCELTFWNNDVTVHMIAYCSLNNVRTPNERFGLCEMYFSYDKYYEDCAIVKVYKLDYCGLD